MPPPRRPPPQWQPPLAVKGLLLLLLPLAVVVEVDEMEEGEEDEKQVVEANPLVVVVVLVAAVLEEDEEEEDAVHVLPCHKVKSFLRQHPLPVEKDLPQLLKLRLVVIEAPVQVAVAARRLLQPPNYYPTNHKEEMRKPRKKWWDKWKRELELALEMAPARVVLRPNDDWVVRVEMNTTRITCHRRS